MRTAHASYYYNIMFNVQTSFLMLISKWINNTSIKIQEIYEMNQYVNLQSLAINSTECVDELLSEREVLYSIAATVGEPFEIKVDLPEGEIV